MTGEATGRRRALRRVAAMLVAGALGAAPAAAQPPPAIAAAANLSGVLDTVAAAFARATGSRVNLVFGASGTLARQIREGAPFELFLSADEEFARQIVQAGLARDEGVVYAEGRLALFAPAGSPLAVDEQLEGLARLAKNGGVTRFAIANPAVAPYGAAAEAVLRRRGLWDALRPHLVLGDTVAQAAQFATTGNAVGGIIAYSLALAPGLAGRGTYVPLPPADHPPLRQRMVRLRRSGAVADSFYRYLQGPDAKAALRASGFAVPD